MSDLVKLYLYRDEGEETVIDIFEARAWEDFVIVKIDPVSDDELTHISESMRVYADSHPDKHVLLFSSESNVEIYGVKADE